MRFKVTPFDFCTDWLRILMLEFDIELTEAFWAGPVRFEITESPGFLKVLRLEVEAVKCHIRHCIYYRKRQC